MSFVNTFTYYCDGCEDETATTEDATIPHDWEEITAEDAPDNEEHHFCSIACKEKWMEESLMAKEEES